MTAWNSTLSLHSSDGGCAAPQAEVRGQRQAKEAQAGKQPIRQKGPQCILLKYQHGTAQEEG